MESDKRNDRVHQCLVALGVMLVMALATLSTLVLVYATTTETADLEKVER